MEIRAFLNDDGTAALSFGQPGSMSSVEVEWHSAELVLRTADGALVRSVTRTAGGETVVGGPEPAPAAKVAATAEVEPHHEGDSVAAADMAGQGFAAFSQHAEEVKG